MSISSPSLSLSRLFKTPPSQRKKEIEVTWQYLEARVNDGNIHHFRFPPLDKERIQKGCFSDDAFTLGILTCHQMTRFISDSESTLIAAMRVIETKLKSIFQNVEHPLYKQVKPFVDFFYALSRIQGCRNFTQSVESPNSRLGTLYRRGVLLLTHFCYRVVWLVSLQEKATVLFDVEKTIEILAADTDWMTVFNGFYRTFSEIEAAESKFSEKYTPVVNVPANPNLPIPLSEDVLAEVRTAGFTPAPKLLFPSACECKTCKVTVDSLFPWQDMASSHDFSLHKVGDKEIILNNLREIRDERMRRTPTNAFLLHELETSGFGERFIVQSRNVKLGLSSHMDMRLHSMRTIEMSGLVEMLRQYESLTEVDLYESFVDTEGAKIISETLASNTTLRALNLGGNRKIGEKGLQSIAAAVQKNHTLEQLTLTYSYDSKNAAEKRLVDLIHVKTEKNRKMQPVVRRNWARVAVLTAFVRANRAHSFQYSVLPLIGKDILGLGDFGIPPDTSQPIEAHENNALPVINEGGGCCLIS